MRNTHDMVRVLKELPSKGNVKIYPIHYSDKNKITTRTNAKNEKYKLLEERMIARCDLIREGFTWKMTLELRSEGRYEQMRGREGRVFMEEGTTSQQSSGTCPLMLLIVVSTQPKCPCQSGPVILAGLLELG